MPAQQASHHLVLPPATHLFSGDHGVPVGSLVARKVRRELLYAFPRNTGPVNTGTLLQPLLGAALHHLVGVGLQGRVGLQLVPELSSQRRLHSQSCLRPSRSDLLEILDWLEVTHSETCNTYQIFSGLVCLGGLGVILGSLLLGEHVGRILSEN